MTEQVEAFRAQAEAELRAADGWLALVGLAWLQPGENAFGSDPSNHIVLPEHLAEKQVRKVQSDINSACIEYNEGS